MKLRILLSTVILLAASVAASAANNETNDPKKAKYKYISSGSSLGFSFFPFLGIEKLPVDSAAIQEVQPYLPRKQQIDSLISSPVVF